MQEKNCTGCGESKVLDEFNRAKKGKFGRQAKCKECRKQYYIKHNDHIKEKSRKQKEDNKEYIKQRNKLYWDSDHGQYIRKKQYTKRKETNTHYTSYSKEYRKLHPDYFKSKKREYHAYKIANDPNYQIKTRVRSRIRQAIKRNYKSTSSMELLGCTIDEFKTHLQQTAIDNGYTDFDINNYSSEEYHIDHIIPCCAFDLTDPEQQKKCFHYSNQQILTAHENLSKAGKVEA